MNFGAVERRGLNINVPNALLSTPTLPNIDEKQAKQRIEAARAESEIIKQNIESLEKLVAGLSAQEETLDYELKSVRNQIATSYKTTNASNQKVFKNLIEIYCIERNHHLKLLAMQSKSQAIQECHTLLQNVLYSGLNGENGKLIPSHEEMEEWVLKQSESLDTVIRRINERAREWLKSDYRGFLGTDEQDMLGSMSLRYREDIPHQHHNNRQPSSLDNKLFQDLIKNYKLVEDNVKQLDEEAMHLELAIQEQEFARLASDVGKAKRNLRHA